MNFQLQRLPFRDPFLYIPCAVSHLTAHCFYWSFDLLTHRALHRRGRGHASTVSLLSPPPASLSHAIPMAPASLFSIRNGTDKSDTPIVIPKIGWLRLPIYIAWGAASIIAKLIGWALCTSVSSAYIHRAFCILHNSVRSRRGLPRFSIFQAIGSLHNEPIPGFPKS